MATTDRLTVSLISPEATVFEGEATSLVAPAWDGEVGILPHHAPMVALLGKGELRVSTGGAERRFEIEGGFFQVVDDTVTILSERARPL